MFIWTLDLGFVDVEFWLLDVGIWLFGRWILVVLVLGFGYLDIRYTSECDF